MTKGQLATWLQTAVTRRTGLRAAVATIECDPQGNPSTMTGTMTIAGKGGAAPTVVPMSWNVMGKAMSSNNDAGMDLVTRVPVSEITPA